MSTKQSIVTDIKDFLNNNYNLSYNLVNRNIEVDNKPVTDIDLNSIYIACKTDCHTATKDLVYSVVYSKSTQPINPFTAFIRAHQNSARATGNIDKLIASISTDTENYELFIKKWLCAMMASIHGKHSPLMLVLCGGQNTGKTEWFRRLLPDELSGYYAESKLDNGKDDELLMTKKLIILDDEFGGKSKLESKRLKELTSKQTFSIREPYGRVSVDLQRLAILCGTTNDTQILNDPTGNRRLLPVLVLDINHTMYNSINKTDLFIEIYDLYKSGYDYNLSKDEIELLNSSTGAFEAVSTEEELVLKYYAVPGAHSVNVKDVTNTDIILRLNLYTSRININAIRLGMVLKRLGFEQRTVRVGKSTGRFYRVIELNP